MSDLKTILANQLIDRGDLIAKIARERANTYGALYAKLQAPISPYQNLTSNKVPEKSLISWLRGVNKCNQFVGDVLTKAGLRMPTFKIKDGSEHYMNAERLPQQNKYFDKICSLSTVKPGDMIVIDDLKRNGESGAHVELVSFIDFAKKVIKLVGARKDGAAERESLILNELPLKSQESCAFIRPEKNQSIYFLRPKFIE